MLNTNQSGSADKEDNEKNFIVISIAVALIILALWLLNYFLLKDLKETERGTFGDMFGSINALFSGLALAGIILTILLQRKELKLQRQELKDTRQEFKTQNETLKLQRFENTFFNLLNQHHQIVNAIDFRYYKKKEEENIGRGISTYPPPPKEKETVIINGRDVFRYLYNKMYIELGKNEYGYETVYMHHYHKAQTDFGHYFRNLYRMIKIVHETDFFYDSSKVSTEEIFKIKYRYTSIIRAQLSDYELMWVFYNCLSENGIDKFKFFVEEYSLLKNLPNDLIAFPSHRTKYNERAFTPNE